MQDLKSVQLKCLTCLEPTVLLNPRNGLPFCCDNHSDLYISKKLVGPGYDANDDSEKRLNELKAMFQIILTNYIHAENQDALWDAKDYLNKLLEVVAFEIRSVQSKYMAYNSYKRELETTLMREDVYEKALEKILAAVRVILQSLATTYNSLLDLELNATTEKSQIDKKLSLY